MNPNLVPSRIERWLFFLTSAVVFIVYYFSSGPGIGLVDSGELTTVTQTLGIAHPTGYPLYTLLGRVWHLLLPMDSARAMVIFSVLVGSCASGILSLIAFRSFGTRVSASPSLVALWSGLLACAFAFSYSAWTSIDFAEVYPLTWLIAALILFVVVTFETANSPSSPSAFLLIAYLWGLGFGNHLTILWFFPLIAFAGVVFVARSTNRWRAFLLFLGLFLLGTSVNLYLPIRSSTNPPLDWSDPQILSGLIRHLTAWQYRVWMFSDSIGAFAAKVWTYLAGMPLDIGFGMLILALIGMVKAFAAKSKLLLCAFTAWIIGALYNLNYSIPDISTYFISFYSALFVIAAVGLAAFAVFLLNHLRSRQFAIVSITLVVLMSAVSSFAITFRHANHSKDRFAVNLAAAILETLPDSALVVQGNWDIQSPLIYLQQINGLRPDIVMLDINLMQRPWYIKQQSRLYPELFSGCQDEIAEFQREVKPFEESKKFDGNRIETAFIALNKKIISNARRTRPVYTRHTRELGHPGVIAGLQTTPGGYFQRVEGNSGEEPVIKVKRVLEGKTVFDNREQYLLGEVASALVAQGQYAMSKDDTLYARAVFNASAELVKEVPPLQQFAAQVLTYLHSKESH